MSDPEGTAGSSGGNNTTIIAAAAVIVVGAAIWYFTAGDEAGDSRGVWPNVECTEPHAPGEQMMVVEHLDQLRDNNGSNPDPALQAQVAAQIERVSNPMFTPADMPDAIRRVHRAWEESKKKATAVWQTIHDELEGIQ